MSDHGGRVEYEGGDDVVDAMSDQIAQDAYPGVFSGGKQIVRTEAVKVGGADTFTFVFDDGSSMTVIGSFHFRYKQPGAGEPVRGGSLTQPTPGSDPAPDLLPPPKDEL